MTTQMYHLSSAQGPDKFELVTRFVDRTAIAFGPTYVILGHLGHEDGSGDSFNFTGHVAHQPAVKIRGYWQTRTRSGWLEIDPENRHPLIGTYELARSRVLPTAD